MGQVQNNVLARGKVNKKIAKEMHTKDGEIYFKLVLGDDVFELLQAKLDELNDS